MPVGPQKIILVRSGLYEYAEVDLNGAIQIVGPNNTGKSTLIKTLQFLYLNDRRQMDLPYSPEQTREFYFPDQ
jgi:predicted ATP-dependent endonuclease of OLD family